MADTPAAEQPQLNPNDKASVQAARIAIRNEVFKRRAPKTMQVLFRGATIEIRQPDLNRILDVRDRGDVGSKASFVNTIVDYCFVPGTQVKVFEDSDAELFMEMPFDEDFLNLNTAIAKMTGVDIAGESKG